MTRLLRVTLGICGVALLWAAVSAALAADERDAKSAEGQSKEDYYALMKVFVDTFDQVERDYVKDVNRRELLQAAIEGMMTKLDPYSSYINPDEMAKFSEAVDQEFGGIGIQVTVDDHSKRLTVMTPLPGTPAYKAGVQAGDVILEIDGKSTEGFVITDAVKLLKGKAGTSVRLGILHHSSAKKVDVTVVRDVIRVATVLGDRYKDDGSWDFMLDKANKVGYIRLTHFSRNSAIELEKAVNQLQSDGMRALILDMRFDPGGLFSQATEIADMFIEGGKIVSTKGRNAPERTWDAKKEGTFPNFPMAIIVNRFSASASEIVSACLQDHHRAVIVGERTWGKGSVQNVIELEGGSSALKLTTASYHRPSGKNIHRFPNAKEEDEWGVHPDQGYEVKLGPRQTEQYMIYRHDRDILSKDGPPKSDFKDRQLEKALEVVRTKLAGATNPANKSKKDDKDAPPAEKDKKAAFRPDARPAQTRLTVGVG